MTRKARETEMLSVNLDTFLPPAPADYYGFSGILQTTTTTTLSIYLSVYSTLPPPAATETVQSRNIPEMPFSFTKFIRVLQTEPTSDPTNTPTVIHRRFLHIIFSLSQFYVAKYLVYYYFSRFSQEITIQMPGAQFAVISRGSSFLRRTIYRPFRLSDIAVVVVSLP